MIEFKMIAVSRKDSKPRLVGMKYEEISRVDEWEDDRDLRIKSRISYKMTPYSDSIMYSITKAKTILNQMKKHEARINKT